MENWTIAEDYTLPSEGKVYAKAINANIKLRSMTTEEEMKRLGKSPYVYKMFSEMIDDCLVEKPGINTYDLCLGDYQFLLYKLRIVTYGPEYKINYICPYCGSVEEMTINLDNLKINKYKESLEKSLEFELPVSKKIIKLKWQTPRMIDEVDKKVREQNSKSSNNIDSAILFNLISLIDTVDGVAMDDVQKEMFVRNLPMRDSNKILRQQEKVLTAIGLDTSITHTCKNCKQEHTFSLPITGEFFRPTED